MHVGIAIQHFHAATGGAEGFAILVTRELLRRGHQITVVAEDGKGFDGLALHTAPMDQWLETLSGLDTDLVVDWGLNIPADLHRLGGGTHREYLRLVQEARPAIIRMFKGIGYRLTRKHQEALRKEAKLIADRGTHFLAVSEFIAGQLKRTGPVTDSQVTVLINGVDASRFDPEKLAPRRRETRQALGIGAEKVVCLLVAHNLWLKNVHLLRRIFPAIVRETPEAHLVLLGKRDPGFRADWFTYAGPSREPEMFYAASDILLHPTLYDACANVVLEAMAAGLPVISSDRNGSAEAITPGKAGAILPVVGPEKDIREAWEREISRFVKDADLRQSMGTAARNWILQNQTVQQYTDRLEALLNRLLSD